MRGSRSDACSGVAVLMQSSRRAVSEVRAGQEPGEGGSLNIDDRHFSLVAELLADGEVVPFLGAGANLCDRPRRLRGQPGSVRAERRASSRARSPRSSRYPNPDDLDLLRVSQYVDAVLGEGPLYALPARGLRRRLSADARCTGCSRGCRALLRERGRAAAARPDDELRRPGRARARRGGRAVRRRLVRGEAERRTQGRFMHRPPDGEVGADRRVRTSTPASPLARAAGDPEAARRDRPRRRRRDDSYVITEDNYIDYLAGGDVGDADPDRAAGERMTDSHFLFLGYSMRDWNLRVILNRIWGGAGSSIASRGRCSASRRRRRRARDRAGALATTAATSTSSTCRCGEYVERLERRRSYAAPAR